MTPGTQGVIVERAVLEDVREALVGCRQVARAYAIDHQSEWAREALVKADAALAKLSALTMETTDA